MPGGTAVLNYWVIAAYSEYNSGMKKGKGGALENIGLCPLCKKKEMGFLFQSAGYHFFRCPACKYVRRGEPASETVDI